MCPSFPRDIHQDFLDLFKLENFIAYFEFSLGAERQSPISGLCKISRSKQEAHQNVGHKGYLSLILIIDTPDDDSHRAAKRILKDFNEDTLRPYLPDLDTLIPMPEMNVGSAMYVKHVDALLKPGPFDERRVIEQSIIPFFKNYLNAGITNLEWWEDRIEGGREKGSPKTAENRDSLIVKLKRLLQR